MRDLNVSAAQGYRVERQTRDDRSARGGHPQAELIVPSRLAVVDDRDAEGMVPHVVERRLADEHPRIADDRERLHGVAFKLHHAGRAEFNVKQRSLCIAIPLVPDVESEAGGHAVVKDSSAARDESERRVIDREHGAVGSGVIAPADADTHVVDVHRNVAQRHAGRQRPADASAARGRRLSDRWRARRDWRQNERHRSRQRDVTRTAVTSLVDRGAESDRTSRSSRRIHLDGRRIRIKSSFTSEESTTKMLRPCAARAASRYSKPNLINLSPCSTTIILTD